MFRRELRRFFRSSRLLSLTGVLVLAVGLGSAALATSLLLALNSHKYPGMPPRGYATIAEGETNGIAMPTTWDRFEDLKGAAHAGVYIAASTIPFDIQFGVHDRQKQIKIAAVSANFFSEFTYPLATGRNFTLSEAGGEGSHVAILSANIASAFFKSSNEAIGRQVYINGDPYLVIGIAAPAFQGIFGWQTDAWVPAKCVIPLIINPGNNAPGASALWKIVNSFYILASSGSQSSESLAKDINRWPLLKKPGSEQQIAVQGVTFDPGKDETIRRWVRLGLGFSLAFSLVSCLNVCLLLMARAPLLVEEVKLKQALGAGPRRILVELAVGPLAMMSLGLAASFAFWLAALFAVERLALIDRQLLLGSASSVLYVLLVQAVIAFLFISGISLVPSAMALRATSVPRMGMTATAGRKTGLFIQIPVAIQIACGMAVWILAGMVTAALLSMMSQPLGFHPEGRSLIAIIISQGTAVFKGKPGASDQFMAMTRAIDHLRTLPGVKSVSYVDSPPLFGAQSIELIQNVNAPSAAPLAVNSVIVTAGYFHTNGTRVLRGRDLSDWLKTGITNEIVLNKLAAEKLFPGQDPIEHTVSVTVPAHYGLATHIYQSRVVGVVENTRTGGYASSSQPTMYEEGHSYSDGMPYLMIDGEIPLLELEAQAKKIVLEQMPGMAVRQTYDLNDEVRKTLAPEKNRALAALTSAGAMAAISFIGLYGSLSFYLRSKRREMAVRMCLGASVGTIRRMVLAQAFWCTVIAAGLSFPAWFALHRLATHEYLGAVSWSWLRAVLITLLCVITSTLFAWIPAASTSSIAPSEVLKEQ